MSAADIAEAMRRVTSGDQTPPRPWAYLAHLGICWVSDTAYLQVPGFFEQAGFDFNTDDGGQYRVMIEKVR